MRSRPTRGSHPAWLPPLLLCLVALFCVLPAGRLLLGAARALADGGAGTILTDAATWRAVRNTLTTSLAGMAISLVLGGVFALTLVLSDARGKLAFGFAFMLPLMIPPQVTALAWIQLTGPSSPLLNALGLAPPMGSPQPLYSLSGIALLLGVQHAPLVFLTMRASLAALPADGVEAARLSGASPFRVLADIVLPLALPGIIAGAAIAFVSGVGNFGIPAMLGIPASIFVLPTFIYSRLASFGTGMLGDMAMLSVLVALIAFAGILVQQLAMRRRDYRTIGLSGPLAGFRLGRFRPAVETALAAIILVILVAPLTALVATSLVPAYGVKLSAATASLAAYREILFVQSVTITAFRNSFFLATTAALALLAITVPLAWWLRQRRGAIAIAVETMIEIPYALPGIVLAVAFILLFAAPLPFVKISIYATIWIILLAYISSFMAVSLKPLASAFSQTDPALEEAASLAGAGFWRRMRDIVLPMIAPAAGASAIMVFLFAVNELTISALLWSAGTQTLGVAVFNLDDGGAASLAAALSVLIVGMVFVLMIALELLAGRLPRGAIPWRA
ncbi:MAG: iron ABC transporter permease [Mesorhizobium sp.]|nr:iron ABC transporter permease [Mesorhizobium sp.]